MRSRVLRVARRIVGVASESVAVAMAGAVGAGVAMQSARARLAVARAVREEVAPASLLEGCTAELRALLSAAAAVAYQDGYARGLLADRSPTWSELSPAEQWLVEEQAARVRLSLPVNVPGWSELRRDAFAVAVRGVLERHAAAAAPLVH